MAFEITIPQLKPKNKTTKDLIIAILSENWPLTSKKIYNIVRNSYNINVTYQAVHKTIKQLLNQDVLEKHGRELKLNTEWIEQIREFAYNLENSYKNNNKQTTFFSNSEINNMVFKTFQELDRFLFKFIKNNLIEIENNGEASYSYWRHGWWPLLYIKDELKFLKEAKIAKNYYIIIMNNTIIDNWCSGFFSKIGMNIETGINLECNYDFLVYNDFVIQIYYPQDLKKSMDIFYTSLKDIRDLDIDYMLKTIFERETQIHLLIMRNAMIAKELKRKILNLFNNSL
jgi:predicted transcriptional regulator